MESIILFPTPAHMNTFFAEKMKAVVDAIKRLNTCKCIEAKSFGTMVDFFVGVTEEMIYHASGQPTKIVHNYFVRLSPAVGKQLQHPQNKSILLKYLSVVGKLEMVATHTTYINGQKGETKVFGGEKWPAELHLAVLKFAETPESLVAIINNVVGHFAKLKMK